MTDLKDTDTRIKWPNDILVEGKKVCGILIQEGIPISTEQVPMKAAWYVIGFGINVENCPLELEPKVGALHGVPSFLLPKVTVGFADNHRAGDGF